MVDRKQTDAKYLQRKIKRGWLRLWIPPELVERVKKMLQEYKSKKD